MPRVHLPDGRIVNFPDGMPPEQITAEVSKLAGPVPEAAAEAPQRTWTDKAVEALPMIGGTVGGLVGRVPVLGTALAGLAGAGGEGYRQTAEALRGNWQNVPDTIGGRIRSMATAGVTQAGLEGAGRGVGALVSKAAPGLYKGALRAAQGLKDKYPGMVKEGLANRVIVGGQRGIEKARAAMGASRQAADTAVAAAEPGATTVGRRELRQGFKPLFEDAKKAAAAGLPDERRAIASRARALPDDLPITEAHDIGRTLNTRADRAFAAERRGGMPASLTDRLNQAEAQAMGQAVKSRTPGLADINTKTSNLYGLTKALKKAADRPSVLSNLMAGGAGVGTMWGGGDIGDAAGAYLTMRGLSSPRTLSGAAIGANEIGRRSNLIPAAVRAALLAQMQGQQP